tara:strand:+ start:44 stop:175 length:132 start_codon:yes stop_codon:yes gene_type:complete
VVEVVVVEVWAVAAVLEDIEHQVQDLLHYKEVLFLLMEHLLFL